MVKSELWIRDHNLELYRSDLVFGDDLPVIVGYLRVSTDDQVDEGHSLTTQPQFIREACVRKFPDGYHLVFVADEGLSGKLPFHRPGLKKGEFRPGLTLVLEMIKQRMINYVGVYKCNRFSRSPRIYLEVWEDYLVPFDVEFFTAVEPVDNRTAAGKYITNILMISSDYERKGILQICRDGQISRIEEGYTLGTPGYGWEWEDRRLIRATHSKTRVGIQPVPAQSLIVRKIIDWFLAGRTIYWICRELERQTIMSPTDKPGWDKSTVMRILRNPHHAGLSKNMKGEYIPGAHYESRIIEEHDHFAVLDRLIKRAEVPSAIQNSPHHIYGEVIHCAICGSRMRLISIQNRPARYRCTGKGAGELHQSFSVCLDVLENWITKQISDASEAFILADMARQELVQIVDAEDDALCCREKLLSGDLARSKDEFIKWARSYSRGEITNDEFTSYNSELQKERIRFETELELTRQQIVHKQKREIRIELAGKALTRFNDIWQNLRLDEKRALADKIIDYVVLTPSAEYVTVSLKLILGDVRTLHIPRTRKQLQGLNALSVSELASAHLFSDGQSALKISRIRKMALRTIYKHRRKLVESTGTDNLSGAIEVFQQTPGTESYNSTLDTSSQSDFARHFTDRQIQFLQLLADGGTNRSIALELRVNITTVADLRRTVYSKLGAADYREALKVARERHIISGSSIWSNKLTSNQLDVLRKLTTGMSQPAIARELGLSVSAVKERVRCMFRKLGVCCVEDLITFARKEGWI